MKEEFHYIIIGSGIAATMICSRLLEADPLSSILVLEAGERIASRNRRSWWDLVLERKTPYSVTYDNDAINSPDQESFSIGNVPWGFKESRVRAYGGSTMHWGGWALRYKEEDFECRSRTGRGADWPFGYDTIEPWYALAEQVLGVGGNAEDEGPRRSGRFPLPEYPWSAHEAELAGGLESVGLKPGHMPIARFKRCITTGTCKYCPIGARYSAQDHMDEMLFAPEHKNLILKIKSPVRRILAERTRVHGVEYLDASSGTLNVAQGQQVIVCAGLYESTKLLLASTCPEWPDGVGNRHDQVGRYIVTHLLFSVEGTRDKNPLRWFQEYDFPTLMSRSWDVPQRQAEGKMFIFNNRSLPKTEFESLMIQGKSRAQIDKVACGPSRAGLSAFIEEFGDSENRLTLANGTGKFGLPKTSVRFSRRDPTRFMQIISSAQDEMFKCLGSLGYQRDEQRKEFPRGDHASGTCRTGRSPDTSVTNENLAVHGVDNLFVCSNAVLPNVAAVNPTLTLAALALRLGTYLSGRESK